MNVWQDFKTIPVMKIILKQVLKKFQPSYIGLELLSLYDKVPALSRTKICLFVLE